MITQDFRQIFSNSFPFWNRLNQDEIDLVCNNTSLMKYKKGANVHGGGNDCIGALFVKNGGLRTYMLSEEGREITLYRLYEGDVCILSVSCVLKSITFDVFIDAEEDSEILLINAGAFSQLAKQNIYVECFAYQLATERFSDVMWVMQQILFMSFDKRLAVFLNDELAKTGGDTVKLTHEQIARYMGSAREVVSRMLKAFASEGIVELGRGDITILNRKKLKDLF